MKTYAELEGDGGSNILGQVTDRIDNLNRRMKGIKYKIAVVSGKGGVGKSSVTASLAGALTRCGYKTGVFDADINGSSIPHMLGVETSKPLRGENGYIPKTGTGGVKVMSLDFMIGSSEAPVNWDGPSETFTWLGAMEATATRELLADTEWGTLDFLLIDTPPVISKVNDIFGLIPNLDGVIIVTIPSAMSYQIVLKTISKVKAAKIPIIGILENMKGFNCQHCGERNELFDRHGMEEAVSYLAPYIGAIPFDKNISEPLSPEGEGKNPPEHNKIFDQICNRIFEYLHPLKLTGGAQ